MRCVAVGNRNRARSSTAKIRRDQNVEDIDGQRSAKHITWLGQTPISSVSLRLARGNNVLRRSTRGGHCYSGRCLTLRFRRHCDNRDTNLRSNDRHTWRRRLVQAQKLTQRTIVVSARNRAIRWNSLRLRAVIFARVQMPMFVGVPTSVAVRMRDLLNRCRIL